MNKSHDRNDRERSREKRLPSVNTGTMLLIFIMVLCVVGLVPNRTMIDDQGAETGKGDQLTISKDCVLRQQIHYSPCNHGITRRIAIPAELIGKTRSDMEAAYADWRITSFSGSDVQMEQTLDLFCPQHIVLKPDEAGILCIWQNNYGDALTLAKQLTTPISDFSDEIQEQLRFGLAFDTEDLLLQWLEANES